MVAGINRLDALVIMRRIHQAYNLVVKYAALLLLKRDYVIMQGDDEGRYVLEYVY